MAQTDNPPTAAPTRDARQDAVLQHVAHEAHAPQHEEHAQRRRGDRQREATRQSAPHEAEGERRDEQIVDQAASSVDASSPEIAGGNRMADPAASAAPPVVTAVMVLSDGIAARRRA